MTPEQAVITALMARIRADGRRVYNGLAPSGVPRPYITLPDITTDPEGLFRRRDIHRSTIVGRIWSQYTDNEEVLEVYNYLTDEFHRPSAFPVTPGFRVSSMRLRLITTMPDADTTGYIGVFELSFRAEAET